MSLSLALLAVQDVSAAAGVAGDGTRETWRLLELPPSWVIVLVLIPLVSPVSYLRSWPASSTSVKPTTWAATSPRG